MNKQELLNGIASDAGCTKAVAEKVIDSFAKAIQNDVLRHGNSVSYPGLGTFKCIETAARTGRNPQTGQPVQISAKTKVGFKPAPALKK